MAGIRARIEAAGGDPARVAVLAVTKGHPIELVDVALAAGLVDLGENYAQELLAKTAGHEAVRWHFIGHLQRNKVRQLAPHVALWQSIDRVELIDELARRSPGAHLLIQVNATGEQDKNGCRPQDCPALVERALAAGLHVDGLMTVGPTDATADPSPGFDTVRTLVDRLGLVTCSMGMTDDLEAAVRHGSTMVRIGTALFGARAPRGSVGH
ncbi:MAG: YggS family pyridoxal phosphate-dependent enzyme [Acidimicrobiales bacterium]|nr:YggS family pyridoxal phosphate-dependent enzyme [Acidimicrobiales bacterium]